MSLSKKAFLPALAGVAGVALLAGPAQAAVSEETAFVFNTFSFLVTGFLVMFMAAGFAMLESGLVRSKNTATILLKNIALYAIAGIMFYLIGYSLMYVDVSGYIGSFSFLYNPSEAETALINADEATEEMVAAVVGNGYSVMSDWFFQMVFVAATASIVSGTLAERIKLWPFLIFTVVLTGVLYPITGSWQWGGGWLAEMGFSDFAGSTLVHSVGGWAALAGAIVLGPRIGKYGKDGKVKAIPGHNIPLAALGVFILWLGWFGFNPGSTTAGITDIAMIFVNTNMAAAAGAVAAMLTSWFIFKKPEIGMSLNGALAGLVGITAGCANVSPTSSILIGLIAGVLVVLSVMFFDRIKIDDPVGAVSVHGVCGAWGTLAAGLFNMEGATAAIVGVQIQGIIAAFIWSFGVAFILFKLIDMTIGLRVTEEEEMIGVDISEHGGHAYNDFQVSK